MYTHKDCMLYDSSLSAAVAPDHFHTGIAKKVLNKCLQELKCDRWRSENEMKVVQATKTNGIFVRNLLRWENITGKF